MLDVIPDSPFGRVVVLFLSFIFWPWVSGPNGSYLSFFEWCVFPWFPRSCVETECRGYRYADGCVPTREHGNEEDRRQKK